MKRKLISLLLVLVLVLSFSLATAMPVSAAKPDDKGFDEFGFNYQARIFVGTGESWAMGKLGLTHEQAEAYMGVYAHDRLVMKWSKGWDDARFHGGTYGSDAWETNEWNGMVPGGSGEVWHYKIIWVGTELEDSDYWREGGYAVWGQFEIIMSQGVVGGEHIWETLASPCGFGGS